MDMSSLRVILGHRIANEFEVVRFSSFVQGFKVQRSTFDIHITKVGTCVIVILGFKMIYLIRD